MKQFREHKGSRHDITMRVAGREELGNLAPPAGPIPGTDYQIEWRKRLWRFARRDGKESAPIDVVFGSGKSGMTYAGRFEKDRLTEFRMSYFPKRKTWYLTPGQEVHADLDIGREHVKHLGRRCVMCHAMATQETTLLPQAHLMGVGCESCHGPGQAHIAAAKTRGAKDLRIEKSRNLPQAKLEAMCARCHRSAADVPLSTVDAGGTQRFQPYGLEMSPCYKKSKGKMTCLTCHDAHTNARTDAAFYEAKCLNCHAFNTGDPPPDQGGPCPINPRNGCIPCHMPQRRIFPGSKISVTMADHFIWAYRPRTQAKAKASDG